MRQAILTKYLSPTNFRGARVKAWAAAGSITLPWDHALGVDENHEQAALALQRKFGWDKHWKLIGGAPDIKSGFVYVQVEKAEGRE